MSTRFACSVLLATLAACAATAAPKHAVKPRKPTAPARSAADAETPTQPMNSEDARQSVAMLDDAYHLILEETHAAYHMKASQPVAATVVRKLQARMNGLGWPRARFLAVNAVVMHPDHVAHDDFERSVQRAFQRGEQRIEQTQDGQLRVGTLVPLGGGCFSCHWSPIGQGSKAAIVWTIPLLAERPR